MIPGITSDPDFITAGVLAPYSGGGSDTQTVMVGADGTIVNSNRRKGFILGSLGSCNPGTSALYSGAAIRELAAEEQFDNSGWTIIFAVSGVVANSGWTSLNIGGSNVLLRANAAFSTAGANSSWSWEDLGNLFGATGSSHVVGFD